MADIKAKLWFDTPDSATLCRAGGNGPNHPSQLYALKKYWNPLSDSLLDYGAGSATTYEAINRTWPEVAVRYLGLDIIPKNVEWCKQRFPQGDFKVNKTIHKIDQPDKSWDTVYSRHVVDHMRSFEEAIDEHKRVAKEYVIVILWVPLSTSDEHQIKNIVENGKVYENEYTNSYSEKKVQEYLESDPEWKLVELTKDVGAEVKGHDTVIVLEKNDIQK